MNLAGKVGMGADLMGCTAVPFVKIGAIETFHRGGVIGRASSFRFFSDVPVKVG